METLPTLWLRGPTTKVSSFLLQGTFCEGHPLANTVRKILIGLKEVKLESLVCLFFVATMQIELH